MVNLNLIAIWFDVILGDFLLARMIFLIDEVMHVRINVISESFLLALITIFVFFILGEHFADLRKILRLWIVSCSLFFGICTHRIIIIFKQKYSLNSSSQQKNLFKKHITQCPFIRLECLIRIYFWSFMDDIIIFRNDLDIVWLIK